VMFASDTPSAVNQHGISTPVGAVSYWRTVK